MIGAPIKSGAPSSDDEGSFGRSSSDVAALLGVKPGEWCAIGLVAAALGMDVALERRGHDSISTCIRENRTARRLVRWFSAHLTDSVQGDLLTIAGTVYAKRVASRVVEAVVDG